jgi:hypothetical protein
VRIGRLVWALAIVLAACARGAPEPAAPLPAQTAAQAHPATIIDAAELAVVRARIASRREPQWTAYQRLIADANEALTRDAPPPRYLYLTPTAWHTYAENVRRSRAVFVDHGRRAYATALAWRLTGDPRYAERSVAIMQGWASADVELIGGAFAGLHSSSHFATFMYAYDLMHGYPGWTGADRARFRDWWYDRVLPANRLVIDAFMPGDDPAGWVPSNWLDAALNSMLATAVAFDDPELEREALDRIGAYFVSDWRIARKPYGPGGSMVAVLNRDIERHTPDLIQGLGYTGYGSASLMQAFETARYNGTDFWTRTTPEGVGYQDVLQQWFDWVYLNEEFHLYLEAQAAGVPVRRRHAHENLLELLNNHYPMSPAFRTYLATHRPVRGNPFNEYATLTKGDIAPRNPPHRGASAPGS